MKTIIIVICTVSLLLLTSCNKSANASVDEPNYTTPSLSTSTDQQTTTSSIVEKPSTTLPTDIIVPDAPDIIFFNSIKEIQKFVTASSGTANQFAQFVNGLSDGDKIQQNAAKIISSSLTSASLPALDSKLSADDFGCTYYTDRNELDLIYTIDGIRYRFVYSYEPSEPHNYEGEPALTALSLGSVSLDLYRGEKCFVGSYMSGPTAIRVVVYTEQPTDVDLSVFELETIAQK